MSIKGMNRRDAIRASIASGLAIPLIGAHEPKTVRRGEHAWDSPEAPHLAKAVDRGLAYFRRRCDEQLPLVLEMRSAIASGDLGAAQRAYIEARPPYEEIETLAASFEASDRDIDARPYVFEGGETDEEFRGFHKIEALLFGYEELGPALRYADRLEQSVRRLRRELDDRRRFSAQGHFEGMFALANEIPAKKISSEEETWSDQTLLIFRHNWVGIYSQYEPFAEAVERASPEVGVSVRKAYESAMATVEPHFRTGTAAGTPYSQIRTGERRAMADASLRLRDAIADAGRAIGFDVI